MLATWTEKQSVLWVKNNYVAGIFKQALKAHTEPFSVDWISRTFFFCPLVSCITKVPRNSYITPFCPSTMSLHFDPGLTEDQKRSIAIPNCRIKIHLYVWCAMIIHWFRYASFIILMKWMWIEMFVAFWRFFVVLEKMVTWLHVTDDVTFCLIH